MTSPAPADHTDRHALVVGAFQTLSRATTDGPDDLVDEAFNVLAILSTDDLGRLYDSASTLMGWIDQQIADRDDPTGCEVCATPIERDGFGRPRRYCSDACRQAAYRSRKITATYLEGRA